MRRLRSLAAAFALAPLLHTGCGEAAPGSGLPAGALLSARPGAVVRVLDSLSRMEGTPLARRARALSERLERLPDCDALEARAESGRLADLFGSLACAAPGGALADLHAERGERDALLMTPLGVGGGPRATAAFALDDHGGLTIELALPRGGFDDARALLLPGAEPAGPGVLSRGDSLVHARVRADGGLDLAAFVPPGSQADRMFRLKSALFAGAVLDGTWEGAVYLPAEGAVAPRIALALGFEHEAPAVAALEEFVEQLRAAWPGQRSFFAVGGAEGACLLDLNLMPELAPCFVSTGRALVLGWNPASVRKALDGPPQEHPGGAGAAPGALVAELSRFPEADAVLATAAGESPTGLAFPWRRLRATGARSGDAIRVRVVLEPSAPGPSVPELPQKETDA